MVERALLVSPEAPYPLDGGGALRTASLLEFLAARFRLDVILFHVEGDEPAGERLPEGLVNDVLHVPLPRHSRRAAPRIVRNTMRLMAGEPPLLNRFSGFASRIGAWLTGRQYELGLIEHFWCAPYVGLLRSHCRHVCVDLHNIESEWHARAGAVEAFPMSIGHRMFGSFYKRMERELLPQFDAVLTASIREAGRLSPLCRTIVYPNAIPFVPPSPLARDYALVFSGNHEYLPNQHAVRFFHREIWPLLKLNHPRLTWRILGKNPQAIPEEVRSDPSIEITGPVGDAIPELSKSLIAVVPVLIGSGTRVKIVEAWAAGLPVVSTSIGAEGLDAVPEVHLLLADTPVQFVESTAKLLESPERQAKLGAAGRALYEERYTWQAAWDILIREKLPGC